MTVWTRDAAGRSDVLRRTLNHNRAAFVRNHAPSAQLGTDRAGREAGNATIRPLHACSRTPRGIAAPPRRANDSWLCAVLHQEPSPTSAEGNRKRQPSDGPFSWVLGDGVEQPHIERHLFGTGHLVRNWGRIGGLSTRCVRACRLNRDVEFRLTDAGVPTWRPGCGWPPGPFSECF
jgi:hypothetical protein